MKQIIFYTVIPLTATLIIGCGGGNNSNQGGNNTNVQQSINGNFVGISTRNASIAYNNDEWKFNIDNNTNTFTANKT